MTKKRHGVGSNAKQRIRNDERIPEASSDDIPESSMQILDLDGDDPSLFSDSVDLIDPKAFLAARQMTRLSAQEVKDYRKQLSQWQTLHRVDTLISEVADKAQLYVVSQGGLKFWREAFVGMSCAQLTHARRFRLGDDPPDFELDYGDHTLRCELVTALPDGLKLGDRYNKYADDLNRDGKTELSSTSFDQGKQEYDSVISDVESLISAKSSKLYPEKYVLVVDIMHEVYFDSDFGLMQELARAARSGLSNFREVWLRQSSRLLRVSPVSTSLISLPWPSDE